MKKVEVKRVSVKPSPYGTWPVDELGFDVKTLRDPLTNMDICRRCWDGAHAKLHERCKEITCMCRCVQRERIRRPSTKATDTQTIDEVYGTIEVR
jgi:hypothetical protein